MSVPDRIGRNIVRLRKEKGITQEALALELNMSIPNLRKIEHGIGNPTIRTLEKIADHLQVSFHSIAGDLTEESGEKEHAGQTDHESTADRQ